MNSLLVILALVAVATAYPTINDNIISTYNDEGVLVTEDLNKPVMTTYAVEMDQLHFMLYTQSNKDSPCELKINNAALLKSCNFNPSVPTKVLIHGWQGSYEGETMQTVKDAVLATYNYNVVLLDYKKYNSPYLTAVNNSKTIAANFAKFLDYLIANGLRLKDVHIMGHSLGAHIAGFAARSMTSGRVPRVTGMDPAGPNFGNADEGDRLSKNDATFVDILHTSTAFGMAKAIGTADFYPNGGENQPACKGNGGCDHTEACIYYAESLKNPKAFAARICSSESEARVATASNKCVSSGAYMGEPALASGSNGIYHVAA